MKQKFLITENARRFIVRASAIFLIVFCLAVKPVIFGQGRVITRNEFSRLSLTERASVFEPTISRIALEEQVDPHLLWTICYLETRFRPWLRSPAGALGLMQFIPATARRFNLSDPFEPEPAIRAAARYVKFLAGRFGGRIDSILAGYNAGEGAVDAYLAGKPVRSDKKIINGSGIKTVGGVPPYTETVSYVARGLIVYRLLQLNRKFSGAFVSFLYPPNLSERLARVRLEDKEIGFHGSLLLQMSNPQFWNVQAFPNNQIPPFNAAASNNVQRVILPREKSMNDKSDVQMNYATISAENSSNNSSTNNPNKEKVVQESNEIYYEPRTGARYNREGGKLERLSENGDLVVGEQSRTSGQPKTIRARGTFFGNKILPPK